MVSLRVSLMMMFRQDLPGPGTQIGKPAMADFPLPGQQRVCQLQILPTPEEGKCKAPNFKVGHQPPGLGGGHQSIASVYALGVKMVDVHHQLDPPRCFAYIIFWGLYGLIQLNLTKPPKNCHPVKPY